MAGASAGHCAETQAQLEALRSRIEALAAELNRAASSRDQTLNELRRNEVRTSALVRQLRAIDRQLEANEHALTELGQDERRQREALREIRAALARSAKVSYSVARQDAVKLLLNQEDPAAVSRALGYHRFFQRLHLARVRELRARLEELSGVRDTIAIKAAALGQLRVDKSAAKTELEAFREQRQALLLALGQEIENGTASLAELRLDEEELVALLSDLEDLGDIPVDATRAESFSELRGELPCPSRGPILHAFGTLRPTDNLKWQGVLIGAGEGAPVRAIFHGRVAFADWLRGFGLLLIIDHGDGYMSLYGQNQSLFKEVGDWVAAGELIAVVGGSGGSEETGLYFEIRHNGTPTNPTQWCAAAQPARTGALVTG